MGEQGLVGMGGVGVSGDGRSRVSGMRGAGLVG